jgi:hypothetical protein
MRPTLFLGTCYMKMSIACLTAAAALFALLPPAQAQTWQRSGMKQGYYAAYAGNADGARLRVDCGQSDEVLSITYIPRRAPASARSAAGAIVIDGRRFAGSFEVAGDEIKVGADDLDSLELVKDAVAHMRNGRSLTIELPQLRLRDSFALNGAAQALGRCR